MKNSARLGMDQASGDYVGMLATVMNAVVLQCALKKIEVDSFLIFTFIFKIDTMSYDDAYLLLKFIETIKHLNLYLESYKL